MTELGPPRLLLTPEEAAAALGISRTRVYALLGARTIRSVRIGKVRRIAVAELEAFVERLHAESAGEIGAGRR